jgi:hypothetical protein
MKKLIVALWAMGLVGSACAQSAPQQANQQPANMTSAATPTVPGAKTATTASLGDLTPFYVVAGVAAVGVIVVATSGSSSHHNAGGGTGGTGTH